MQPSHSLTCSSAENPIQAMNDSGMIKHSQEWFIVWMWQLKESNQV